jgi:predicted amidohydrolase
MRNGGERQACRVAMAQILVEGGKPDRNLARACAAIAEARAAECSVAVLPECLDCGWTHPSAKDLACPIPGARSDALAGVYVVAGLVEREGSCLYNAAVLLSPEGAILTKHRKINELDIATGLYTPGASLSVARTELGRVAVNICADNFPESLALGHSMARMGAQLLLSPCAWAVDADHDNEKEPYGDLWLGAYSELARLYDMTVIGVSNVGRLTAGPWAGRRCIGCSLAVGAGGKVLARGPYGADAEALIVVEADLRAPVAQGTGFADVLRRRGYAGP